MLIGIKCGQTSQNGGHFTLVLRPVRKEWCEYGPVFGDPQNSAKQEVSTFLLSEI